MAISASGSTEPVPVPHRVIRFVPADDTLGQHIIHGDVSSAHPETNTNSRYPGIFIDVRADAGLRTGDPFITSFGTKVGARRQAA
jgi:hypothetical protein